MRPLQRNLVLTGHLLHVQVFHFASVKNRQDHFLTGLEAPVVLYLLVGITLDGAMRPSALGR